MVCLENETEFNRLENGEICYGLDELANTYCPDFWNDVDPLERLNNTASDGHIYTLRGGYNNAAVYEDEKIPISPPWTMNIRTDFLEKLNSPMPTSVEELETLLYTAKASGFTMPYRMRGAAETPLASWMGVKRDLSWDAEAKKVRTPLRDEAWLPYLKMMAKWYRDGVLILPEQEDLLQKDLTRNSGGLEETASIAFVSAIPRQFAYYGSTYLGDLYSQHIGDKDIVSFPFALWMEPLTYHGRVQLQAADQAIANWDNTPGKGWRHRGSTFISRGCSNPERAILFLQFLKSDEGAKIAVWGVPGEQYTLDENDMPLSKEGYQASKRESGDWGISNYPFLYGINYWNFVDNSWVSGTLEGAPVAYVTNKTILTLRQMQIQAGIHYKKYLAKNKNPVFSFAWPKAGTPDDTKLKGPPAKMGGEYPGHHHPVGRRYRRRGYLESSLHRDGNPGAGYPGGQHDRPLRRRAQALSGGGVFHRYSAMKNPGRNSLAETQVLFKGLKKMWGMDVINIVFTYGTAVTKYDICVFVHKGYAYSVIAQIDQDCPQASREIMDAIVASVTLG